MSYETEYKNRLAKQRERAGPQGMAICISWHGKHFGKPGWGSEEWVAGEVDKALKAIDIVKRETLSHIRCSTCGKPPGPRCPLKCDEYH